MVASLACMWDLVTELTKLPPPTDRPASRCSLLCILLPNKCHIVDDLPMPVFLFISCCQLRFICRVLCNNLSLRSIVSIFQNNSTQCYIFFQVITTPDIFTTRCFCKPVVRTSIMEVVEVILEDVQKKKKS